MQATIDVPDSVFEALRDWADQRHSSVQEVILEAIRKEISQDVIAGPERRVRLPLVRSKHPGSLRSLTNAEIEALLG